MTIFQSFVLSGCVTVLVPVLFCLVLIVLGYVALSHGFEESKIALESLSGSPTAAVRENVLRAGDAGAGVVALVKVQGAIMGDGSPLDGTGNMAYIADQLRAAAEDAAVKAVILQIDSPGGGLTASDLLHNEIMKLRANGKTVVAWTSDLMASGGYYIAVGAEKIYASPTSTIGSIGVIMRHYRVDELMQKLGIRSDPIVSGNHKDIGSPFREMTQEERKILQDFIGAAHERFVRIVADGRGMPVEQVRKLADGSIFTAEAAQAAGLVDSIGYLEDAIAGVEDMLGRTGMRIISYRRPTGLVDLFREAGQGVGVGLFGTAANHPASAPMAVWDGR